jgi:hypothetical protein
MLKTTFILALLFPALGLGQQDLTWSRVYEVSFGHAFPGHEKTIEAAAARSARVQASEEFGATHLKVRQSGSGSMDAQVMSGASSVQTLSHTQRTDAQGRVWSDFQFLVRIDAADMQRQISSVRNLNQASLEARRAARSAEILEHQVRAQRSPQDPDHRIAAMVLQSLQRGE